MDITLSKVLPAGIPTQLPQVANVASQPNPIESFSKVLSQALEDVNTIHQGADVDAARLASGDDAVDLHQVMIGMEKANIAMGLTVQVRNKLVEAYQEVMRMQV